MENKKSETTITIDIIYDIMNPPPKDAITHVEIDSSYLPKLKRFSEELSNFNSSPAKPEPAKSDHVCRNKVGTLNHLVSETGGRLNEKVKNGK